MNFRDLHVPISCTVDSRYTSQNTVQTPQSDATKTEIRYDAKSKGMYVDPECEYQYDEYEMIFILHIDIPILAVHIHIDNVTIYVVCKI